MIIKSILGAGYVLVFTAIGATAGTVPVPLDVTSYNFVLAGGGGGSAATLNGVSVEIFCDDFANDLDAPSTHTGNVTDLSTSPDLSLTRFGGVASNAWTTITLNDGAGVDAQDNSFFNTGNGTAALARYEMAAYLVSLYNVVKGSNPSNNEIQEAIWTIMDPKAEGAVINPSGLSPDSYLEQAASWYMGMNTPGNQGALNSFLSQFEIVTSPKLTYVNGLGIGGYQEQIIMDPVVTPEPRGGVWLLLFLLVVGFLGMRRFRGTNGTAGTGNVLGCV